MGENDKSDESQKLLIFGREAPSKQFTEATETLNNYSVETIAEILDGLFADEERIKDTIGIPTSETEGAQSVFEDAEVDESDQERIRFFFRRLTRAIGGLSIDIESRQIADDLAKSNLESERSERVAKTITENRDAIRDLLVQVSTVRTAPALLDVRWNLSIKKRTGAVEGIDEERVTMSLVLDAGSDIESVTFEMGTNEFEVLKRNVEHIENSLDGVEMDIEP